MLKKICFIPLIVFALFVNFAKAQQSYSSRSDYVEASPKPGWRGVPVKPSEDSDFEDVLLWVPNRIVDFIDIFKFDIGAGPIVGAEVRATKFLMAGARFQSPMGLRVGALGRRFPVMFERKSEYGLTPFYKYSHQREICNYEFGAGLDLILGVYAGLCFDELADFFTGFANTDLLEDDF
jgi:hypothetical protein